MLYTMHRGQIQHTSMSERHIWKHRVACASLHTTAHCFVIFVNKPKLEWTYSIINQRCHQVLCQWWHTFQSQRKQAGCYDPFWLPRFFPPQGKSYFIQKLHVGFFVLGLGSYLVPSLLFSKSTLPCKVLDNHRWSFSKECQEGILNEWRMLYKYQLP